MRILMLSSNTGEGHNSTAKAIMDVLRERGVECRMEDVLACLSPKFSKFICNWHSRIYKYAPKLSDVGYRALERNYTPEPEDTTALYELLSLGAGRLWEIIAAGNYDAVVCVHVFSALMMTEVRRSWGTTMPCFFVATDYSPAPFLDKCDMDGFFIPGEYLRNDFAAMGVSAERLIPSGIPVRQEFYTQGNQKQAREELGLPENGSVVLLMCGSMGCGPIRRVGKELSQRLPEDSVVVAICGNNEKLYESMVGLQNPRLRVLAFTKNVSAYMDAADLVVTKPGGLSTTEAACKHLPMVLINAVGGCEAKNFERFLNRGYAVGSKDPDKVVEQTLTLLSDFQRLKEIRENLTANFAQNSAWVIADRVISEAERIKPGKYGHPFREEGGCSMEFMNSETRRNLARAFAGEAQARMRYTIYADVARQENYEWIARIFEETAANEAVHARQFFEKIKALGGCGADIELSAGYPFELGDTAANLAGAASGELHEHDDAYPAFAEMARQEGYQEVARLFLQISRVEGVHHNTFRSLHEQLISGTLTEKASPISWRCLHCGYTYEGIRACDPCPVCGKSAGWQQGDLDEKKLIPKK